MIRGPLSATASTPKIQMEIFERPEHAGYQVSFFVSMRDMFHANEAEFTRHMLREAAAQLGAGIKNHLESASFRAEIATVAREELRPLLKQALIDRLDEIVEDVLA